MVFPTRDPTEEQPTKHTERPRIPYKMLTVLMYVFQLMETAHLRIEIQALIIFRLELFDFLKNLLRSFLLGSFRLPEMTKGLSGCIWLL